MTRGLTIGCAVHHDEACINIDRFVSMLERNGVGVASQPILDFVKMNLMVGTFEGP